MIAPCLPHGNRAFPLTTLAGNSLAAGNQPRGPNVLGCIRPVECILRSLKPALF